MNRHVVFVHGLRRPGEPVWMSSAEPPERWPLWLREEIEGLGVWSLEHDSAPTRWRGHAMPRVDRASNALAAIMREPRLKNGEIAFVAHSFGGLIVQELLRTADGRSATDADIAAFLKRVRRIAFLGTPHRGATLPVVSNALRIFGMQSAATEGMRRNDPDLRGLIQWFRKYAPENGISTLSLIESRRSGFLGLYGQVVKPDSADAGLPSDPILVDEDHFGIASPKSRESDVYGEVRKFLTKPATAAHSRTLVDAALDGISKVADTTAALERMQVSVAGQHFRAAVASSIADKECERRLDALIKKRFLRGSGHQEESTRLAKALIEGELASVSSSMKARALAWCGRLMVSKPDRTEGLTAIEAAKTFGRTDELVIAEAFAQFYETKSLDGLSRLAAIDSKLARSASFIIVGNSRNATDALAWLQQSGLAFSDFDGDGKFFILVKQFETDDWSGALENVDTLSESDFLETAALIRAAAQTHLAQALPKELIPFVFSSRASEVAPTPLRDDAQSLEHRRTARQLFLRSCTVAEQLGCEPESSEASDWGLILGLRDPATRAECREELEQSMRDAKHALRRIPIAIQTNLNLDLDAVHKEIDKQEALSGGGSPDVAVARLSMALLNKDAAAAADEIEKHRSLFIKFLMPAYFAAIEIQVLTRAGRINEAEACATSVLSDPKLSDHERTRFTRLIAEAKGQDPVEAREAQFKASDSLPDLINLTTLLQSNRDWARLAVYGKTLFERTGDLGSCRTYAQALFERGENDAVIQLLTNDRSLLAQSGDLMSLLAWSYYRNGDVLNSKKCLAELRAICDHQNGRTLLVNLAISSCDWPSLLAFTEQEWEKREERDGEELLRAGQLAQYLGSPRAKELIFAASEKAAGDPHILLGCYGAAIGAGWETQETAQWLELAAALSGEDGPVQRFSIRELAQLNPDWHQRETRTWEQLQAGLVPIFAVGHVLNRTLIDLFLLPALGNAEQADPRRRAAIYAYSGARNPISGKFASAAIDPTALLTFGMLGELERVFAKCERIVIPHSTGAWLFDEKQRIQFHQPSRVAEAKELKQLLDAKSLHKFEPTATIDGELAKELGDDLASLIVEAKADFGEDKRQRLVVRSAPIHRVDSLMEEEADLKGNETHLCGCAEVVNALIRQGELTEADAVRARSYLELREQQRPTEPSIVADAVLYLDSLSVSYLQHLGLLPKLSRAGFTAFVPVGDVSQSQNLLRYEHLTARVSAVIDAIRKSLSDGIQSGKVVLSKARNANDDAQPIKNHPTIELIGIPNVDIILADDRFVNQNGRINNAGGARVVWTSLDLLRSEFYSADERREFVTRLRQAGYCFVPLEVKELLDLVSAATVANGKLAETAELKALRESLQVSRMANAIQFPKEHVWLENMIRAFLEAIRAQWYDGMDEAVARAKSNWLLEQFDIRQWASAYRVDGQPGISELRWRGQALALSMFVANVSPATRTKYWDWLDEALLKPIKDTEPETYAALVEQVRTSIMGVAESGPDGGPYGS